MIRYLESITCKKRWKCLFDLEMGRVKRKMFKCFRNAELAAKLVELKLLFKFMSARSRNDDLALQ